MIAYPTPALTAGAALQKAGLKLACFLLVCSALASCASSRPVAKVNAPVQQPPLYDWRGDELSGPTTVNVVLNEQKAYIYRGGQPAGWTYLASGKPGHATPTGTFTVLEKKPQKSSGTYGMIVDSSGNVIDSDAEAGDPVPRGGRFVGAPMPYWMRLTGYGIGMHVGNIPNPGSPASHGCIRLPRGLAPKLYDVVDVGTKVIVTRDAIVSSPQVVAGNY